MVILRLWTTLIPLLLTTSYHKSSCDASPFQTEDTFEVPLTQIQDQFYPLRKYDAEQDHSEDQALLLNLIDATSVRLLGGFIGCLYEDVCFPNEKCMNDSLFGKCVKRLDDEEDWEKPAHLDRDALVLTVTPDTFAKIADIIKHLKTYNFTWGDVYSQCVVRSIVLSSNLQGSIDWKELCGPLPEKDSDDWVWVNGKLDSGDGAQELHDSDASSDFVLVGASHDLTGPTDALRYNDRLLFDAIRPQPHDDQTWKFNFLSEWDPPHRLYQLPPIKSKRLEDVMFQSPVEENQLVTNDERKLRTPAAHQQHESKTKAGKRFFKRTAKVRTTSKDDRIKQKRRYRLRMNAQDQEPSRRTWVWIKFTGRTLSVYDAEQYLQLLFQKLHIPFKSALYLDTAKQIVYFQVPPASHVDANYVLEKLRSGEADISGYTVDTYGYGRGAYVNRPVEAIRSPKDYTLTLVICFSILGVILLLLIAYSVQTCRRYMSRKWEQRVGGKFDLLDEEKSFGAGEPEKSLDALGTVKRFISRRINPWNGSNPRPQVHPQHLITPTIKASTASVNPQPIPENIHKSHQQDQQQQQQHQQQHRQQEARHQRPEQHRNSSEDSGCSSKPNWLTNVRKESTGSQRSSSSSWSSEPAQMSMDVTTGHLILSYMEEHLRNRDHLDADWAIVNAYEAEEAVPCEAATWPENAGKNRRGVPFPYEQTRVKLRNHNADYINASLLYDHEPRNPAYIATPSPMRATLLDFWQMVWEQASVVIVCLERSSELHDAIDENQPADVSVRYWPEEGSAIFGNFEVHLVSEHNWCDEYLVRSFYLKNLKLGETRTVTQFHFLAWTDEPIIGNVKPLLEFRRKVNKSFRGKSSPIVVHCIDGCGRTGTYILLDLVLNRLSKGVKELDIAASLEHLRDQRQCVIQTKEQFEFVLTAIAEEVNEILRNNA